MMGRSILATGLVAWALIGAPALCVAGLIGHTCEPAGIAGRTTALDCACEAEPNDPESPGSSHEGDCDQDPCTGRLVRPESPEDLPKSESAVIAAIEPIRSDVVLKSLLRMANGAGPGHLPSPGRFHPSDLPLLL